MIINHSYSFEESICLSRLSLSCCNSYHLYYNTISIKLIMTIIIIISNEFPAINCANIDQYTIISINQRPKTA